MRDKLIALLGFAPYGNRCMSDCFFADSIEKIADYLIAHGVTFVEDNNVPIKKAVLYNVERGALCPTCDGNLDFKLTVKTFFRKNNYILRHQSNCCKHCGQALDWGNEPPKGESNDED